VKLELALLVGELELLTRELKRGPVELRDKGSTSKVILELRAQRSTG